MDYIPPIASRTDKTRSRGPTAVMGLVAAGLILSAVTGDQGLRGAWRLDREVAEAEQKNFELVQRISAIREEIRAIENDDETLERVARRQAHLVRPGEVLYRLSPANP